MAKRGRKPKRQSREPAKPVECDITILDSWEIQQRIKRAIMLIHHSARYFEGMQILCELAGYSKNALINQYDSPAERRATRQHFNNWVRKLAEQA